MTPVSSIYACRTMVGIGWEWDPAAPEWDAKWHGTGLLLWQVIDRMRITTHIQQNKLSLYCYFYGIDFCRENLSDMHI